MTSRRDFLLAGVTAGAGAAAARSLLELPSIEIVRQLSREPRSIVVDSLPLFNVPAGGMALIDTLSTDFVPRIGAHGSKIDSHVPGTAPIFYPFVVWNSFTRPGLILEAGDRLEVRLVRGGK